MRHGNLYKRQLTINLSLTQVETKHNIQYPHDSLLHHCFRFSMKRRMRDPSWLNFISAGAPPSVQAEGDAPASFLFSFFLFQSGQDRKDVRSSRRCGNVRKRPCLRSCGKRCLRAVGKPAAFPSGRECLFSIGGAAVFHISIALRAFTASQKSIKPRSAGKLTAQNGEHYSKSLGF